MLEYVVYQTNDKTNRRLEASNEQSAKEEDIEFYSPWYSGSKKLSYTQ